MKACAPRILSQGAPHVLSVFLVLLAIAYLLWRITDQLPDLICLSEIQRDVAELRRQEQDD